MPILTQTEALQLSQLTERIAESISNSFAHQTYWVIGDVSGHTFYPNKEHHYFELVEKDEGSQTLVAKAPAVAWRAGAARIRAFEAASGQRFRAGIRVCVKVQVDYHALYGLKLIVQDVDPSYTIGQFQLQRQATINRLLKECAAHVKQLGDRFCTSNNSLAHGRVIQRVAVLSSSASAGYQDFMHTLSQNGFGYRFYVNSYFTTVQGEANAEAASEKLKEICASGMAFDAVVIIRGGGSDTDFLIFDQFVLCAAVARLPIPVITGIGHLKNETIVDLMAHTPTKTPTKAAEFIIAHNQAFEQRLLSEQQRIVIKSQQILARHQQEVMAGQTTLSGKVRRVLNERKQLQERTRQRVVLQSKKLLNQQKFWLAEAANKTINRPQQKLAAQRGALETLAREVKYFASVLLAHEDRAVREKKEDIKYFAASFINGEKKTVSHYETMCRMMSPVNILKKGFALVYQHGQIVTEGERLNRTEPIKVRLLDTELTATIQDKKHIDGDSFNL